MTRLALLGSPGDAALSPALHRAAYTAMGLPWTYHAIECRPQDLPRLLGSLDGSWRGFSLTMPLSGPLSRSWTRRRKRSRGSARRTPSS
ncbi:hypothetical protein ACF1A9_20350 [Streptomyces sp. NPDC014872]|uniref:hypothetical protein n=1 Tax=Streptomyces sp. NPDC014872 TaxID=3364926 RepID=UPI0036FC1E1A